MSLDGKLVPRRYVELSLAKGQRAEAVLVEEGDHVVVGDPLIRLEGYAQDAASVAAEEEQVLLAQQALEELQRNAETALAEATLSVRQAEDAQVLAEDLLESLVRPPSKEQIEQAHANLLLAELQLDQAQEDLRKAEHKFKNKKHIIWWFINTRQFKLRLTLMRKEEAFYERRYWDAKEKYEDLIAPVDEIDVAVAEAELAAANARLRQAERQRDEMSAGPDLDLVEAAEARLKAAQADLAAAQEKLRTRTLFSPLDGTVASLTVKSGEWVPSGTPAAVVGDLGAWLVETDDLREEDLPAIKPGQAVQVVLDAFPDEILNGVVEAIDLTPTEVDGDVYYTARIRLEENDLPLRWGMSVSIEVTS